MLPVAEGGGGNDVGGEDGGVGGGDDEEGGGGEPVDGGKSGGGVEGWGGGGDVRGAGGGDCGGDGEGGGGGEEDGEVFGGLASPRSDADNGVGAKAFLISSAKFSFVKFSLAISDSSQKSQLEMARKMRRRKMHRKYEFRTTI